MAISSLRENWTDEMGQVYAESMARPLSTGAPAACRGISCFRRTHSCAPTQLQRASRRSTGRLVASTQALAGTYLGIASDGA
jgi:Tfp pilus assembly protein PilV